MRVNFDDARFNGVEFNTEARLSRDFTATGNFTYIRAHSLLNGLPPNVEGGVPPATGFVSLRYQPRGSSRFYVEPYAILAGRQNRLSSLDLADRRTGAPRSRTQIQNFFRRGACVRGVTTPGATGCGSAGGTTDLDRRDAGAGAEPTPADRRDHQRRDRRQQRHEPSRSSATSPATGWSACAARLRFGERSELFVDFENIADKQYRGISWGVDGAGRGVTLRYRYKF